MRRAAVTALMMIVLVGCSAQTIRPTAYDPSKGTAVLRLGPGADADRMGTGRQLTLLGVRDASGHSVISGEPRDACTLAPIELNPGRYTVEVARCTSSCTGRRFSFELEAQRGHDYRVRIDKAILSLQLLVTEWEAFLADESADSSRSIGTAVERCN